MSESVTSFHVVCQNPSTLSTHHQSTYFVRTYKMGRPERPPRIEKSAWVGTGGKPRVYTSMCSLCRSFCRQRFTEAELVEHERSNHANCLSCYATFGMSRNTMRCVRGHHLCNKCTRHYVKSKCASRDFPILCSVCRDEISPKDMAHMMSPNQLREYDTAAIQRNLTPNEIFFACQNVRCRSACIVSIGNCDPTKLCPSLIPCNSCALSSCIACHKTEHADNTVTDEVHQKHRNCMSMLNIKRAFEQAIADGTSFQCPTCKRGGRKDFSGCSNICCERCGTNWCYICHRALSAGHHCATHLHTYTLTQEQLHRRHTRQLLHKVFLKYGRDQLKQLWDQFPSVRAHGYSFDEIVEPVENG